MFAHILILVLWLPLAFLASVVECLFSDDELSEMGICTEYPLTLQAASY